MAAEFMLITKHFVFIHLQKTGGVFFRRLCHDHLPSDWLVEESKRDARRVRRDPGRVRAPAGDRLHTQSLGLVRVLVPLGDAVPGVGEARGAAERDASLGDAVWPRRLRLPAGGDQRMHPPRRQAPLGGGDAGLGRGPPDRDLRPAGPGTIPATCRPNSPTGTRTTAARSRWAGSSICGTTSCPSWSATRYRRRRSSWRRSGLHRRRHGSKRGAYADYYDDELRELVGRNARHVIAEHGYDVLTTADAVSGDEDALVQEQRLVAVPQVRRARRPSKPVPFGPASRTWIRPSSQIARRPSVTAPGISASAVVETPHVEPVEVLAVAVQSSGIGKCVFPVPGTPFGPGGTFERSVMRVLTVSASSFPCVVRQRAVWTRGAGRGAAHVGDRYLDRDVGLVRGRGHVSRSARHIGPSRPSRPARRWHRASRPSAQPSAPPAGCRNRTRAAVHGCGSAPCRGCRRARAARAAARRLRGGGSRGGAGCQSGPSVYRPKFWPSDVAHPIPRTH